MIEIPRAAMAAAEVATHAEFFSFGMNDLTQMTFGYSRDDAERNFLVTYVTEGILPKNPFQTLDHAGVGELMLGDLRPVLDSKWASVVNIAVTPSRLSDVT